MSEITTKHGLLYREGIQLSCPEADKVAYEHGFQWAEQMVRHLEDGAPYCHHCGAKFKKFCNCPPPAKNE